LASRRARRARSSTLANGASARAATMRSAASSGRPLMRLRPRRTGRRRETLPFERALPAADRDVDLAHLDAVLARVAHELRRRVEAHRPGVEQAAEKGVGMVPLDPARDVREQSEAGGMALGETVFAEALDLLEDALGVLERIALLDHSPDQALVEGREPAAPLPRRHRAAQRVGLAGREVGGEHRDLHHLLLEDRHALGAAERGPELGGAIDLAVGQEPVLQVGVDHAALDRTRADDRDLDHEVVVGARLQARQHAHLRPALDLEHADGVGAADHVVGGGVAVGHDRSSRSDGRAWWRRCTRARGGSRSACRWRGCRP
jgi:hypothetical protein